MGEVEELQSRIAILESRIDELVSHFPTKHQDQLSNKKEIDPATPKGVILTEENRKDYPQYVAFSWLLDKMVQVGANAYTDVSPAYFGDVVYKIGLVKAVSISDTPQGVSADLAVEFFLPLHGGHECYGACAPHRGFWFGMNHVEVVGHETEKG
jgi:hypothetical protein